MRHNNEMLLLSLKQILLTFQTVKFSQIVKKNETNSPRSGELVPFRYNFFFCFYFAYFFHSDHDSCLVSCIEITIYDLRISITSTEDPPSQ